MAGLLPVPNVGESEPIVFFDVTFGGKSKNLLSLQHPLNENSNERQESRSVASDYIFLQTQCPRLPRTSASSVLVKARESMGSRKATKPANSTE